MDKVELLKEKGFDGNDLNFERFVVDEFRADNMGVYVVCGLHLVRFECCE